MSKLKRLTILVLLFFVLSTSTTFAASYNHSSPSPRPSPIPSALLRTGEGEGVFNPPSNLPVLDEGYQEPALGTVPLPPSNKLAYPFPEGLAQVTVHSPAEVSPNEPFTIRVTFKTSKPPDWSALMVLMQLYLPGGTNLPTEWRQKCLSPWAPEDNVELAGTIEVLPSLDWIYQNWDTWYGVGIVPHREGYLIIASAQAWSHGHYFVARNGDRVTWEFSPISFDAVGTYTFVLSPMTYYWDATRRFVIGAEPISFTVNVVES